MKFYDSDLASDNPADFHSDHEPPKDKIYDKKLLRKEELRRIHKQIITIGGPINKPAKYDEVKAKWIRVLDENQTTDEIMKIEEVNVFNMGLNKHPDWVELALENMKRNEISLIIIENLKYDQNKMKILDFHEYYHIQLLDWTTIIDLDRDFCYFKSVIERGSGLDRPQLADDVTFTYKIFVNNNEVMTNSYDSVSLSSLLEAPPSEKLDKNIFKILRSMKPGEKSFTTIKKIENFQNNADSIKFKELKLDSNDLLQIEIVLDQLVTVDDIFGDQSVVKKVYLKGRDSSKPENNSLMYFDVIIYDDNDHEIFNSVTKNHREFLSFPPPIAPDDEKDFDYLTNLKCCAFYLDEYKVSRAIRHTLKTMKRGEFSTVLCKDISLIKYGIDFEAISTLKKKPESLLYKIKLHHFKDGANTFIMSLEEKIENAIRKKEIGLKLIGDKIFKRALKTFQNINSYFELGKFTEEDHLKIKTHKLSSLLNTTLCQMKMGNWKDLILTADKVLKIDENNVKATYRKALALKELQEYEDSLKILKVYLNNNEGKVEKEVVSDFEFLMKSVEKLQASYESKQKKVYASMFG